MHDDLTVHLIDDDPDILDSLATALAAAGYKCAAYPSGTEFMTSIGKTRPGCAIIDMQMPGMNGLEVMAALKDQAIGLPVIFMTGFGEVKMAVDAMKAGAMDFVEKPCSLDRLKGLIGRAFEQIEATSPKTEDREEAIRRLGRLTARERDVLECVIAGDANKIAAFKLGISARTVEIHRARIMEKAQVRSVPELVRLAIAAGVGPKLA